MKRKIFLFLSCILTVQAVTFNEVVEEELKYVEPEIGFEIKSNDDGYTFVKRPEALWSDNGTENLEVEVDEKTIKKVTDNSISLYEDGNLQHYKYKAKNNGKEINFLIEKNYLNGQLNKKYIYKGEEYKKDNNSSFSYYIQRKYNKEGEYAYGSKIGKWQENNITSEYCNGRLHGKWKDNETGSEIQYVNGFKNGVCKEVDTELDVLEIITYKYGVRDGKYKKYKSGKLVLEGMYKDNQEIGEWIEYDDEGNIIQKLEK